MNNNFIELLRPYALIVIEQYGKLKNTDFFPKLQLVLIENGIEPTWLESNIIEISILTNKLIENAISDWLEKQFLNYPHPTIRNKQEIISGKVASVDESSASSMYSYSSTYGWDLWSASGMAAGKKLQAIILYDEIEPYYTVWGKDSIGIRKFNIIDFKWEQKKGFRIITKKTLEGHGDGFSGSKSVIVHKVHYPSIRSAYARINPAITYSAICTRLRNGLPPDEAFDKPNMRINSDINKLGVVVKKDIWIKNNTNI